MKIAFASHLFPTESEPLNGTFVAEQACALADLGVDVTVLSPKWEKNPRAQRGLRLDTQFGHVKWRSGIPSALNVLLAEPRYRRWLGERLRSVRPDLVHAHYGFPDGVAAVRAAKRLGLPVVVTLHGSDVNHQLRRPIVGRLLARALADADALICVSAAMIDVLRAIDPRLTRRAVVIPNGFQSDDVTFRTDRRRDSVLFVGGLRPVKNPVAVVDAFAAIADRTDLRLVMAGGGELSSELRRRVRDLGLAGRVDLLGDVAHPDLDGLLAHARVLVMPSRSEGLPIALLEALGAGVPVVASQVGAIPRFIRPGVNGFLVKPGDSDGLARALERACAETWDHARIAAEGRAYTWEANAAACRGLYEEILGGEALRKDVTYLCLQSTREGQASHAHVHGIVDGLSAEGWRVELIEPTPAQGRGVIGRLLRIPGVLWAASRALKGARILYVRDHPLAGPVIVKARRLGVPVVVELNGRYDELYVQFPFTRTIAPLVQRWARRRLRSSDAVIGVTPGLARFAEDFAGVRDVSVVPNAADVRRFTPQEALPHPHRYVAYVGVLAEWQGIDTMLDAVVADEWPEDVRLHIAGDGVLRPMVERAAAQHPERVEYLGVLPYSDVPTFLASSEVALSLQNDVRGLGQHSPIKMFEALASGVPLVVTDFPGQSDVVSECGAGFVVPVDDARAVAVAVRQACADAAANGRMGARARECAVRSHSWQVRAQATSEVLSRVLGRRSS